MKQNQNVAEAKKIASTICSGLAELDVTIEHSKALELIAKLGGVKGWRSLRAKLSGSNQSLPGSMNRKQIIDIINGLEYGMQADIWYDADDFGDESASNAIEETQNSMTAAVDVLKAIIGLPGAQNILGSEVPAETTEGSGEFTVIGRLYETDDVEITHVIAADAEQAEDLFVKDLADTYGCSIDNIKNRGYEVYCIFPGHLKSVGSSFH